MFETLAAALIAAAASVMCQLIVAGSAARKNAVELAARRQRLDDEIHRLTERVDEHNSYAALFARHTESLCELASDMKLIKKDVQYIKEGRFNGASDQ